MIPSSFIDYTQHLEIITKALSLNFKSAKNRVEMARQLSPNF